MARKSLSEIKGRILDLDHMLQLELLVWMNESFSLPLDWSFDEEEVEQPKASASRAVVEMIKRKLGITLQLELIKCGKENCRKCAQGPSHGPYWYGYYKSDGRTRSVYIGKDNRKADAWATSQEEAGFNIGGKDAGERTR
jgi:hypothetical protein